MLLVLILIKKTKKRLLKLNIIDEALPLKEAIIKSELIYVAIPVDATIPIILEILNRINDKQIVADAGSTKHALSQSNGKTPDAFKALCLHIQCGEQSIAGPKRLCIMLLQGAVA